MKIIQLTKGLTSQVSDQDFDRINEFLWHATISQHGIYAKGYPDGQRFLLHRFILNAPKGLEVDHINHNGLDNRRENLRLVTRSQNQFNQRKLNRNVYKQRSGKWQARLTIGTFDTEIEAIAAVNLCRKRVLTWLKGSGRG